MRFIKKFFRALFIFILSISILFSLFAVITGRMWMFPAVWHNFAGINDYKFFRNDTLSIAQPKPWNEAKNINKISYPDSLNNLLESLNSVALLAIQNDSIVFEKYWDGYSDSSLSGSFSMAKSVVSLLIGAAIHDGKIKSVDQYASDFIPEFKDGDKEKVRIIDLLTMSSGSDWNESYINPISVTTEAYYGNDLYKTATGIKIIHAPGTLHKYQSGNTELLGIIVEKATGKKLAQYATEKLWQPLGAEHAALWSTDDNGEAKAYCCINSNARDFARIGKLMLDSGRINNVPVIDSAYFANSIKACNIPDINGVPCDYYGYQWWLDPENKGVFYARGILGQYIIMIPAKKLIIVRLGKMTSISRVHTVPKETRYLINWGLGF